MARIWQAEQVADEVLAAQLIDEQFPELAPCRLKLLGVGWDNTAYQVNDRYVFRFPRRQVAADLLSIQPAILSLIALRVPLAVPVTQWVGKPTAKFSWMFLGYNHLPGDPGEEKNLGDNERLALATEIGQFLAALHAIPLHTARATGLPDDTIGRLDLAKRIPKALEYLEEVKELGLIESKEPFQSLIESSANLPACDQLILVHGDLHARHLILDSSNQICGVIDWDDVHAGDPAIDLAIAHGFLPAAGHQAFLQAYGLPVSEQTWLLARFRAIYLALILISYGHNTGNRPIVAEGQIALTYIMNACEMS